MIFQRFRETGIRIGIAYHLSECTLSGMQLFDKDGRLGEGFLGCGDCCLQSGNDVGNIGPDIFRYYFRGDILHSFGQYAEIGDDIVGACHDFAESRLLNAFNEEKFSFQGRKLARDPGRNIDK